MLKFMLRGIIRIMIGRIQRIDQCINEINNVAKSYNLEVWPNIRDTLMDIVESGTVFLEDKLKAFDLYDEYLVFSTLEDLEYDE